MPQPVGPTGPFIVTEPVTFVVHEDREHTYFYVRADDPSDDED